MTTTASISGQSIGTGSNVGAKLFPQKVTVNVATTAFVISGRVTNGTGNYPQTLYVRIWFTSSSFSVTAAQAVDQLNRAPARYLDLPLKEAAGQVTIKDSMLEVLTGGYIYLWCEVPTMTTAATLDVNVVELP